VSTLAAQTGPPRSERKGRLRGPCTYVAYGRSLVRNSPRGWTPKTLPMTEVECWESRPGKAVRPRAPLTVVPAKAGTQRLTRTITEVSNNALPTEHATPPSDASTRPPRRDVWSRGWPGGQGSLGGRPGRPAVFVEAGCRVEAPRPDARVRRGASHKTPSRAAALLSQGTTQAFAARGTGAGSQKTAQAPMRRRQASPPYEANPNKHDCRPGPQHCYPADA